jgi:multidrug resistance efflux pump
MQSKKNYIFYVFIGMLFIVMLFITMHFFNGAKHSLVGVTYAKEYIINSEKPSLVKKVNVISGQDVKVGDLLVELSSSDLDMEIDRLQNRILAIETEQSEKTKLVNSEIAYIKAEYSITTEELNATIAELQSELALNQKLTEQFTDKPANADHSQDPNQLRLSSLNQQKNMHQSAINIKIQELLQRNNTEQTLLNNQVMLLQRELALLLAEQKKLNKYATFNGVVENVFVKNGEVLNSFTPVISVNPTHPTTVVAYLTGRKGEEIPIGSSVNIISYDHVKVQTSGKVIGFGSVVELPLILQKSTAIKAFGREIFIEIDLANDFATGEKVLIR